MDRPFLVIDVYGGYLVIPVNYYAPPFAVVTPVRAFTPLPGFPLALFAWLPLCVYLVCDTYTDYLRFLLLVTALPLPAVRGCRLPFGLPYTCGCPPYLPNVTLPAVLQTLRYRTDYTASYYRLRWFPRFVSFCYPICSLC